MGKNAVTGIGAASVIHHVSIQAAKASTFGASGEIRSTGKKKYSRMKRSGPKKKPMRLVEVTVLFFVSNSLNVLKLIEHHHIDTSPLPLSCGRGVSEVRACLPVGRDGVRF